MKYSGKIITIAFPDTFVRLSDERLVSLMVRSRLIGKGDFIKAGHAALILIENATGNAQYFDFGRYVTPEGKGRVRGEQTDVELEVPIRAELATDGSLHNLEEFLLWLDSNPDKTHGSGRLIAGVCNVIDHQKAITFILELQSKGSVPYKAFPSKEGSNCARLVTDTILASTDHSRIQRLLTRNKRFSPSTVGNVEKATDDKRIFEVYSGDVQEYTSTAFRENITNYFDRNVPQISSKDQKLQASLTDATYLSGIGASAYFRLKENPEDKSVYEISRFSESGKMDFKGLFSVDNSTFDAKKSYRFVYDSNCLYCHIEQEQQRYRFDLIKRIIEIN